MSRGIVSNGCGTLGYGGQHDLGAWYDRFFVWGMSWRHFKPPQILLTDLHRRDGHAIDCLVLNVTYSTLVQKLLQDLALVSIGVLVVPQQLVLLLCRYVSFVDRARSIHSKLTSRSLMLHDDSRANSLTSKRRFLLIDRPVLVAEVGHPRGRWYAIPVERPITDCIVADVAFVAEVVYLWWRFRRRCLPEVGSALSSRCEAVRAG